MKKIRPHFASKIAKNIDGSLSGIDVLIDKISLNSKENDENWCFFAIKGEKFNGNDFIDQAITNGATLIVSDEIHSSKVSTIYVENTKIALGAFAKTQINNTKVIAITGSVGKTTTKEMIVSVLRQKYNVCGTKDNQNNEIGVPLTLLDINNHDFCVVEMGMRGVGEIDYLASICKPECTIITNCGTSHLEKLKTKENIFLAKAEILNYSPKIAILPNEKRFKKLKLDGEISCFFEGENCKIVSYKYSQKGIIFTVKFENEIVENIILHSFYLHNIYNALIAFIVGKIYGVNNEKIKAGIEAFRSGKMREYYEEINGIIVINDCYNSSFESVKSALFSFEKYCNLKNKNSAALLGDILEAGEGAEQIHEEIGNICKKLKINKLFYYGRYAENIRKKYGECIIFDDKNKASMEILRRLDKNDALLVKGSREMHLEEILLNMKVNKNE